MYCEKCGAQNEEGAKICSECKNPIEQPEEIAVEVSADTVQEPIVEDISTPEENDVVEVEEEAFFEEQPQKKNYKKLIAPVIAFLVLAIIVFGACKLVSGVFSSKEPDYEKMPLFYVTKDAELNVLKAGAKKPATLTDDEYIGNMSYYDGYEVVSVAEDGKSFCYVKEDDDGDKALYFRKTSDKTGRNEVLIDKDVDDFIMDKKGKFVLFRDGDKLYYSDMKESYRIAKDVGGYILTESGKKVLFTRMDEDYKISYYIRGLKLKDKEEMIVSAADGFMAYSFDEDGNEYVTENEWYYRKGEDLYYKKAGKDEVKVLSNAVDYGFVGARLYVSVAKAVTVKDVSGEESSELQYIDNDSEKEGIQIDVIDIYELKGDKAGEPVVTGAFDVDFENYTVKTFKEDISGKEFKSVEEIEEKIVYNFIKKDGTLVPLETLDFDKVAQYRVSEDEKYLYAIENADENTDQGTLVRYKLNGKKISDKAEKIGDDISSFHLFDGFVRVEKGEEMGVYKNGKYQKITDKKYQIVGVFEDENVFYFLDAYDYTEEDGILKKYENGKIIEIAKDVNGSYIDFRSSDMLYYIANYDDEKSGELYVCKGKKSEKLADNAEFILFY